MSMTPENSRDLNQGVCTSDPILVIVAWEGDKLSSGQTDDRWPHTHTHTQTQTMTIPEGHNWPRAKIDMQQ